MSILHKIIKLHSDLAKDNLEKYYYAFAGGMTKVKTDMLSLLQVYLETGTISSPLLKWGEIIGRQGKSICTGLEPVFNILNTISVKVPFNVPEKLCINCNGDDVFSIVKGYAYLITYLCYGSPYKYQYTDNIDSFNELFNKRAESLVYKVTSQVKANVENLTNDEVSSILSEILSDDVISEVRDNVMIGADGEEVVVESNLSQEGLAKGNELEFAYEQVVADVREVVMQYNFYAQHMKTLPNYKYENDTVESVTKFLPWFLVETTQVDIEGKQILCSTEAVSNDLIAIHDSFNIQTLGSYYEKPFTVNGIITNIMTGLIRQCLTLEYTDEFTEEFSHKIHTPDKVYNELYAIVSSGIFSMYARSIPHLKELIEELLEIQELCDKYYSEQYPLQSQIICSYLIASIPERFNTYLKLSRYPSSADMNDVNIWLYNGSPKHICPNIISIYKTLIYLKDVEFKGMVQKCIKYSNDILGRYPYFIKYFVSNFVPTCDTLFGPKHFNELLDMSNRLSAGLYKIELAYGTNSTVKIFKTVTDSIINQTVYDTVCDTSGNTTEAAKKETLLIAVTKAISRKEKACLLNYKVDGDKIVYNTALPDCNISELIMLMTPKLSPYDEDNLSMYCGVIDAKGIISNDGLTQNVYVVKDTEYDFRLNDSGEMIPCMYYYTNNAEVKGTGITTQNIPSWNKLVVQTDIGPFMIMCKVPFKSTVAIKQSF